MTELESRRLGLPRVDAVGVVQTPASFHAHRRDRSAGVRAMALALLAVFFVVASLTTANSLGRYCITSQTSHP